MNWFYFRYLLLLFLCVSQTVTYSQRECALTVIIANSGQLENTQAAAPVAEVITIPVVVHVVYNNQEQNISYEQIKSQIRVLNEDYRKQNADAINIPAAFRELAGDARFEFRLATTDPAGNPSTGVIRKQTPVTAFTTDDKVKFSSFGGDDAWNRDQYLNIWVTNLINGVMGYSSLPGSAPETDGVVIRYSVFGSMPYMPAPFNKGRTAVHEIGHWLGLRHIWGDADCGDDKIEDTPPQKGPTRGCPSGIVATCSSGASGNMYMNFMDFTNDECTNMFTHGQVLRMRSLFANGGARNAILSSGKAAGAAVEEQQVQITEAGKLYPNPANQFVNINLSEQYQPGEVINIYNHSGQLVHSMKAQANIVRIATQQLPEGLYFVKAGKRKTMKFVKSAS